jgi:hypothetical protein
MEARKLEDRRKEIETALNEIVDAVEKGNCGLSYDCDPPDRRSLGVALLAASQSRYRRCSWLRWIEEFLIGGPFFKERSHKLLLSKSPFS